MSSPMKFKRCPSCKKELELNRQNFYYHCSHKDGFSTLCIPCSKVSFKKFYSKHSERLRKYAREYRKTHKKEISLFKKIYYQKNKERLNPKKNKYQREQLVLYKTKLFERFGFKCNKCGFGDWRALQVDHIDGNGAEERKRLRGLMFYKYLLTLSETELHSSYQLLCANCQWIKRFEKQEYYLKYGNQKFKLPIAQKG